MLIKSQDLPTSGSDSHKAMRKKFYNYLLTTKIIK